MRPESFERIVGKEGIRSPSLIFVTVAGYAVIVFAYIWRVWHEGQNFISIAMTMPSHHVWAAIAFGLFIAMGVLPKCFRYNYVLPLVWCALLIHVGEAKRVGLPAALEGAWVIMIVLAIPSALLFRLRGPCRNGELRADSIRNYSLAMVMWMTCLAYAYVSWRAYMDGTDYILAGRPFICVILIASGAWFAVSEGAERPYILPIAAGSIVMLELSVWLLSLETVHQFLLVEHFQWLIIGGHILMVALLLLLLYRQHNVYIKDRLRELFPPEH